MIRATLTDRAKHVLLEGWTSDATNPDSPFVTAGGRTYVRFDEVTIRMRHPDPGVQVVYSFCGREIFTQELDHYAAGMSIHLRGFDGKMPVSLSGK